MPKLSREFTIWFDVPDDPLKGRVEIRHIPDGEISEITSMAIDQRLVFGDEGVRRDSSYSVAKDTELTICRSVKSWENFFNDDGATDLPCTDANKMRYARELWFREFVTDCRKITAEQYNQQREAQRKN